MAILSTDSKIYITTKSTETHYVQSGNITGQLLICLHGLGGSVKTFRTLLPYLPQDYNIILVDFQGFGKTPLTSTTKPLSIDNHVSDLYDLVTFLQGNQDSLAKKKGVIFIGHSLGTIIALQYTARYPFNTAGLALLGVGRSASHISAVRERMLEVATNTRQHGIDYTADKSVVNNFPSPDQRIVSAENLAEVRKAVASSDPEGYARTCEMVVNPSHVDPDYSKILCPVVFVAGDMDTISPPQRSEDVNKLLGRSGRIEIVKSGHQPLIDDFEATKSIILNYLASL